MTDHDTELKLQAHLDGELSATESENIRALISNDAGVRALHSELLGVKALLKGNELELKVPVSREFYWSGIARGIEREERVVRSKPASTSIFSSWMRLLLPAAAVAALTITLTIGWHLPGGARAGFPALVGSHEIETPLEDTPSFTFRSEPEAMTVVWVDSGPN